MRSNVVCGLRLALMCGLPVIPASVSVAQVAEASQEQGEEVVVTARRSGIPVWRVSGPKTTIVLAGGIDGIARTTRWNPLPLTQALMKSDRVMFPDTVGVSASPFAMIGYLARWKKQATLPKGQSLASMLTVTQYTKLIALRRQGVLKAGFERRHPLHLAIELRNFAKGKTGYGPALSTYVRRTVKKNKLKLVPIPRAQARPLADALFKTSPRRHVPCLMDAVTLVEAGAGAIKARSDAWAARRVPEVLRSPAEKVTISCQPFGDAPGNAVDDLRRTVRGLMADRRTTLAVISLDTLARPGGILDDLVAAGFEVTGPRWKA